MDYINSPDSTANSPETNEAESQVVDAIKGVPEPVGKHIPVTDNARCLEDRVQCIVVPNCS
jgi:hypothetical protein